MAVLYSTVLCHTNVAGSKSIKQLSECGEGERVRVGAADSTPDPRSQSRSRSGVSDLTDTTNLLWDLRALACCEQ